MRKTLLASVLALASMLSQAQELLPNLRLLPGGLQVIERENAATSPFDTKQDRPICPKRRASRTPCLAFRLRFK